MVVGALVDSLVTPFPKDNSRETHVRNYELEAKTINMLIHERWEKD